MILYNSSCCVLKHLTLQVASSSPKSSSTPVNCKQHKKVTGMIVVYSEAPNIRWQGWKPLKIFLSPKLRSGISIINERSSLNTMDTSRTRRIAMANPRGSAMSQASQAPQFDGVGQQHQWCKHFKSPFYDAVALWSQITASCANQYNASKPLCVATSNLTNSPGSVLLSWTFSFSAAESVPCPMAKQNRQGEANLCKSLPDVRHVLE